ncbi:ATP-binding protein [Nocardia uniformis]|uniref:ATP-binding protein n=1 Tax=Nocardia uniformis TaxID=53432 RepID=A0A849C5B7_9NOCA|nr:ATP-binding protein [Nocardia uniformis]NNH71007.1 ATP-binding protein [Nocardia uniformis]
MAGHVIVESDHEVWAWTAVQITAAYDLTRRADFQRLDPEQRLAAAIADQTPFIDRLLAEPDRAVMALRWIQAERGRLSLWLIGRVQGTDHADAIERADQLSTRMSILPTMIASEQVTTTEETHRALDPFPIAPDGIAQIVKRVRAHRSIRSDAGVSNYLAVEPFSRRAVDWAALMTVLRDAPHPVALTIALAPCAVPHTLRASLEHEAMRYRRLREPVELPTDLGGTVRHPADPSAAVLAPIFDDALHRYTHRVFRYSVTIAAPVRLDDTLAEAVGRTISPRPANSDTSRHDDATIAAGYTITRPTSPELAMLTRAHAAIEVTAPRLPELHGLLEQDRTRDRHPLVLLHGLVDTTEATSLFRFPTALDGTLPGFEVRAAPDSERVIARQLGPSLLLGYQGETRHPHSAVHLSIADLPRHGFIVGTPGSGKTNTALHLCRQLWQDHRTPFLVMEPVNSAMNDYRWLMTQPGFEELLILTVGDETVAPLRLNPFQVPHGVTVGAHTSNLLACFEAALGLWDPLPFIYRRAITLTYRRHNLHPGERSTPELDGTWPVLSEFVAALSDVTNDLGYSGEIGHNIDAASRLRAESLAEGSCGSTLDCRNSFPLAPLLARPVIVELAAIGDNAKEQALVTLLLLNAVRSYRRNAPGAAAQTHVMLIEEAHRIFPRSTPSGGDMKEANAQALAAERIAQGLAEDRKYRQSYILIDQQVGKVSEDAYKITNLKLMHRTAADEDRKLLGSTMSMEPNQIDLAAALKPFTAIASHNLLDRAVTLTVPDVRGDDAAARGVADAPLADNLQVRERHAELLTSAIEFAEAMAPFPECDGCHTRCLFRQHAASLTASKDTAAGLLNEATSTGWTGLTHKLIMLAGPTPLDVASKSADEDFRVCVLIHAIHRAHPTHGTSLTTRARAIEWARIVRNNLADVP